MRGTVIGIVRTVRQDAAASLRTAVVRIIDTGRERATALDSSTVVIALAV